jgi:hypothetical protein
LNHAPAASPWRGRVPEEREEANVNPPDPAADAKLARKLETARRRREASGSYPASPRPVYVVRGIGPGVWRWCDTVDSDEQPHFKVEDGALFFGVAGAYEAVPWPTPSA